MPLKTSQVETNQRVSSIDHNRLGNYVLQNLGLFARLLHAPSGGVLRPGTLTPSAGTMFCTLGAPLVAVTGAGEVILIEADQALGPFQPNSSGNPRIDLVSVGYTEPESDQESRYFVVPATLQEYSQLTYTTRTATPVVSITTGIPAANPSPPSTPSGHIPLWQVRVNSGVTEIVAADITRVEDAQVEPIRYADLYEWGGARTEPWTSTQEGIKSSLRFAVPDGRHCLVMAQATVSLALGAAGSITPAQSLGLSIEDVAVPGTPLAEAFVPFFQLTTATQQAITAQVLALLTGPITAKEYQVRIRKLGNVSGWTDWTQFYLSPATTGAPTSFMAAILL